MSESWSFWCSVILMNKVLLPEFPGNNLLFHAISNGNAVDAANLLQSNTAITQIRRPKSTLATLMEPLPSISQSWFRTYRWWNSSSTMEQMWTLKYVMLHTGIQRHRWKDTSPLLSIEKQLWTYCFASRQWCEHYFGWQERADPSPLRS